MNSAPDSWIEMNTGSFGFGALGGGIVAGGRSTLIATVAIGTATMKMISRTRRMSTKGVTLISEF